MADSDSSITPEKRLLKLIETGEKPDQEKIASVVGRQKRPEPSTQTGTESMNPAEALKPSFQEQVKLFAESAKRYFGLRTVNHFARIALGIFILVAASNSGYEYYISMNKPLDGLEAPVVNVPNIKMDEKDEGLKDLKLADSRNVFLPFSKRVETNEQSRSSESNRLIQMTRSLKLTGISYNPDKEEMNYCMIEDLAKNITVFMRVGDRISGMQVSQIHEESIELEYDNEKIELR